MREEENWGKYSKQQLIKRAIDLTKEGRWHEAVSINQLHMQSYYFACQKTIEVPSIALSIYNMTSVQG